DVLDLGRQLDAAGKADATIADEAAVFADQDVAVGDHQAGGIDDGAGTCVVRGGVAIVDAHQLDDRADDFVDGERRVRTGGTGTSVALVLPLADDAQLFLYGGDVAGALDIRLVEA